jgi:AbrB family looped-hinge helix DNA binding protein
MKMTIDKAGRVVIPAAVRERAGFEPGVSLEITLDEFGVRLQRHAAGPRLVRVGGRPVRGRWSSPPIGRWSTWRD